MTSNRLRRFVWSVLGVAILALLLNFFVRTEAERGLTYFTLALILMSTGFEMVRLELQELRRALASNDGIEAEQAGPSGETR